MLDDKVPWFGNITWLRGVATIGVLAIHASAPLISYNENLNEFALSYLIVVNQLARFCVPVFFLISGVLYGILYDDKEIVYKSFISRRFVNIFIPYTVWSLIYLFLNCFTGEMGCGDLSEIALNYLTGNSYGHLYFIPAIFQFYLSLPLLLLIVRKINTKSLFCLFWVVVCIFVIMIYRYRIINLNSSTSVYYLFESYWFFWWFVFAILGLQFKFYINWFSLDGKYILYFIAVLFVMVFIMFQEVRASLVNGGMYNLFFVSSKIEVSVGFLRPTAFFYALMCCVLGFHLIVANKLPFFKLLSSVGKYSFGIYLAHPLVNKLLLKSLKMLGVHVYDTQSSFYILILGGTVVSYWLTKMVAKLPISVYLIGKTE